MRASSGLRATFSDSVIPDKGVAYRKKSLIVAALTATYLLLELPFNAMLLDVVGTSATPDDIEHIERFGRLISGLAVALLWWSLRTIPLAVANSSGIGSTVVRMAVSGAVIVTAVFYAEEALIEGLVDRSTPTERQTAVLLSVFTGELIADRAVLDGSNLDAQTLRTPEGKSFMALFQFLAAGTDRLHEKTADAIPAVIRSRIRSEMGSPEFAYNEVYIPSVRVLAKKYELYVKANNALSEGYAQQRPEADKAWAKYIAELKERFGPELRISRFYNASIIKKLHIEGLAVPDTFKPLDKATFYKTVYEKVKLQADVPFWDATRRISSAPVPKGIRSFEEFTADRHIQKHWKNDLSLAGPSVLKPSYTFSQFTSVVYDVEIEHQTEELTEKVYAKRGLFADGEVYEEDGLNAVRAKIVPPIALAFSVAGAATHLLKLLLACLAVILPFRPMAKLAAVAGTVALFVSSYWATNTVTDSRVYAYFEGQVTQKAPHGVGHGVVAVCRWVVQTQPYVYPVNEWLRQNVLLGYTYGVERGQ